MPGIVPPIHLHTWIGLVLLHDTGAALRLELGAKRVSVLAAVRADSSRILRRGAHMQVAILDDDRLIAAEQRRILLLHAGEIVERFLFVE